MSKYGILFQLIMGVHPVLSMPKCWEEAPAGFGKTPDLPADSVIKICLQQITLKLSLILSQKNHHKLLGG